MLIFSVLENKTIVLLIFSIIFTISLFGFGILAKFENSDESLLEISKALEIKKENTSLELVVFRAGKKVTLGR